jgi:hypothetical protein
MSRQSKPDHDDLLEDLQRRQSNTVWPDTMRNGVSVDGYLWNGNPKAPLVQRVGAVIWGLAFLGFAGLFAYLAATKKFTPLYLFTAGLGYIGLRFISNAFRR